MKFRVIATGEILKDVYIDTYDGGVNLVKYDTELGEFVPILMCSSLSVLLTFVEEIEK